MHFFKTVSVTEWLLLYYKTMQRSYVFHIEAILRTPRQLRHFSCWWRGIELTLPRGLPGFDFQWEKINIHLCGTVNSNNNDIINQFLHTVCHHDKQLTIESCTVAQHIKCNGQIQMAVMNHSRCYFCGSITNLSDVNIQWNGSPITLLRIKRPLVNMKYKNAGNNVDKYKSKAIIMLGEQVKCRYQIHQRLTSKVP